MEEMPKVDILSLHSSVSVSSFVFILLVAVVGRGMGYEQWTLVAGQSLCVLTVHPYLPI